MKRYINKLLIGLTVLFMAGCDLDKFPNERLSEDDVIDAKSIANLLVGVYEAARYPLMGNNILYIDYMSDSFTELTQSGNRGGFFYRQATVSSYSDVETMWYEHYRAIGRANYLLMHVDKVLENNPDDEKEIKQYKGEAILWRAILHRSVALRWSEAYDPATASQKLGIPYIEAFNLNEDPSRGTLQDTYDKILRDITEAEDLLSKEGEANSTNFTVDCIPALKAQVYVDMHNYPAAITEVNKLTTKYPLATDEDDIYDMWRYDDSSETIFQIGLLTSEITAVLRYIEYWGGNAGYIPEQWVVDLYDQADWRTDVFLAETTLDTGVDAITFEKLQGNIDLRTNPTTPNAYTMAKLFRMGDLILLKAESEFRSGTGDALGTLNTLREARGLTALSGLTGDALWKEIQNERMREMIGEGRRLFDIKRWKLTVTRDYQPVGTTLANGGSHDKTISYDDNTILLPIPLVEFGSNPNLAGQQNPGYSE